LISLPKAGIDHQALRIICPLAGDDAVGIDLETGIGQFLQDIFGSVSSFCRSLEAIVSLCFIAGIERKFLQRIRSWPMARKLRC
jgi:hypothetical protein